MNGAIMNTKRLNTSILLPLLLAACLASLPALAQSARLQITNLDKLSNKAAEVVDVTLDGSMLKLAAKFLGESKDPEEVGVKELVDKLKGIYVKSFEFDKEGEYSSEDVEAIRAQLRAPAWSRVVGVTSKRDGENAEVYLMTAGDAGNILGLAVICADPTELTVVNIVGPIDIDRLVAIEGKMGIPSLNLEKDKTVKKTGVRHDEK
jgi:hypothetical protein